MIVAEPAVFVWPEESESDLGAVRGRWMRRIFPALRRNVGGKPGAAKRAALGGMSRVPAIGRPNQVEALETEHAKDRSPGNDLDGPVVAIDFDLVVRF